MHIGIDARLPFFRLGGISEYTVNLIHAMAALPDRDAGVRVTVIQARGDRVTRFPGGASGFVRFDADTPCHHPWERLLLGAEIRHLSLDVLHSPDFIPPASGARRRVITVHDLGFLDYPEHHTPESLRHYAGQIDWALQAADLVVTLGEYVRLRLIDRFQLTPDRVVAVPPAAAERFSRAPPVAEVAAVLARHGLERGYLLHVGVLEPRKNLLMLMRAHDVLRNDRGCPTPLVLAGPEGWLCQDILDAVRRRAGAVRHLGPVAPRDLVCLYAAARALVVPSLHEGFGLPVLEAMASGCPVVASTGGALPEVAADAALLVDPSSPDAWADAMSMLVSDRELARGLRAKGRDRAACFSWRRTAAEMLRAYGRAASSAG